MIYLIKRGPRPVCHRAPFHPVIICAINRVSKLQAGSTSDKAWVWVRGNCDTGEGFLLARWSGLDLDYGHIIHDVGPMPDGSDTAFFHNEQKEPWTLLNGAIWWHDKPIPKWLQSRGVSYAPDEHSRQSILDQIAKDSTSGFGRKIPSFWPPSKFGPSYLENP